MQQFTCCLCLYSRSDIDENDTLTIINGHMTCIEHANHFANPLLNLAISHTERQR